MGDYTPVAFDAEDENEQREEKRVQAYNGIFVSYTDAALWEIEKVQRHLEAAQEALSRRIPGIRLQKNTPRLLHFKPVGFPWVSLVSNVVHDLSAWEVNGNVTNIVFHYAAHSLKHSLTVCKTVEWADLLKEAGIERHPCMVELLALEEKEIEVINANAPKRFE